MKRKKLHIHSDCWYWGGSENMVGLFLRSRMIAKDFDVSFSFRDSPAYKNGMWKWLPSNTINKLIFGKRVFKMWTPVKFVYWLGKFWKPFMILKYFAMPYEIIGMWFMFKATKPDVLHINNGGYFGATSCNSAAIAGKLANVPLITYMVNSSAVNQWWERPLNYVLSKCVNTWVTASKHLNGRIEFLTGKDGDARVVPNTIWPNIKKDKKQMREELGVIDDQLLYLCCGVLEERKGFDLAIKAFKDVTADTNRRIELFIKGEGSQRKKLQKMVDAQVNVFLSTEDLKISDVDMINACDVLVVPSVSDEDFPNVILMALYCGVPVIGTNIAGIPEQIKHCGGQVVISGMVSHLEYAMNMLLNNKRRKRLAKEAKEKFKSDYTSDKIMKKWGGIWHQKSQS